MKYLMRLFFVAFYMAFAVSLFYHKVISPDPFNDSTHSASRVVLSEEENRVLVVVSEVNLEVGFRPIEECQVKRIKYPERLLPRYSPLDVKDVLGKDVVEPIYRGEIVSLQRLMDRVGGGSPVGVGTLDGWKTLRISGGKGYTPILARGMLVDIAARYACVPDGKTETIEVCRTIVRRARVLEIGKEALKRMQFAELAKDDEAVTFAMTKQANAIVDLVNTQSNVSFYIILRSAEYSDDPDTEGFGVDQLKNRSVKRDFAANERPEPFDLSKMKSSREELSRSFYRPNSTPSTEHKKEEEDSFDGADFSDFKDEDEDEDEVDDDDFDAFDGF